MGYQRNAACPETRIFVGTGNLFAELFGELAPNRRDIHTDFFEDTATHDRHHPTAAATRLFGGAFPGLALEPAGGTVSKRTA